MDAVLADFRPDVVHLHNIYHQLSPSVLRPVARAEVPAVMTLHDYKLACPTYQFLDHGNLCQACLGGHFQHADPAPLQGRLARVERGDGRRSCSCTRSPARTRRCASSSVRADSSRAGCVRRACIPRRMRHVPHFIDTSGHPVKTRPGRVCSCSPDGSRRRRGSTSRSVPWARSKAAVLDIAGTGPDEARLRRLADSVAPGRVRFHGLVDKAEVQRLMLAAAVVVVPVALVREPADGRPRGARARGAGRRQRPRRHAGAHRAWRDGRPRAGRTIRTALAAALRPYVQRPGASGLRCATERARRSSRSSRRSAISTGSMRCTTLAARAVQPRAA